MILLCIIFVLCMGLLGRMSGNGFGASFGMPFLPELLFSLPFGIVPTYFFYQHCPSFDLCLAIFIILSAISYAGMQSATWYFLRWTKHSDPNLTRGGTVKPIVDWLAALGGWKLGDEGYSWVGAAVKGFIIGLPVGGVLTAILWPLGYEIGSHARGRVEKLGIDPHAVSEFLSAAGGGVSIVLFIKLMGGF